MTPPGSDGNGGAERPGPLILDDFGRARGAGRADDGDPGARDQRAIRLLGAAGGVVSTTFVV